MPEAWLFWVATGFAAALLILFSLAGFAFMGVFLAGLIVFLVFKALAPHERDVIDGQLRDACSRLPFCDCRKPRA